MTTTQTRRSTIASTGLVIAIQVYGSFHRPGAPLTVVRPNCPQWMHGNESEVRISEQPTTLALLPAKLLFFDSRHSDVAQNVHLPGGPNRETPDSPQ